MKFNPHIAGVIGFSALILLLAVAMVIGPKTDDIKATADDLDTLISDIKQTNEEADQRGRRLSGVSWGCQMVLETASNWKQSAMGHSADSGRLIGEYLGADESRVDLDPRLVGRLDVILGLLVDGWEIIEAQLDACIDTN